jgi:tol-pal system protein YbgF
MPPPPADTPPGAAAPAPGQAPAPDLAQQVQNLEARVQQLESQSGQQQSQTAPPAPAAAKPRPLPTPAAAGSPKAAAPAAASPGSEKNYTEGMRLYHAKKYSEAQNQLHQYLKSQPKGPKAPEARYYLADSFYQEGKFKEAGVEFNKLRVQFPKSILAPAGLLRQALCYKNQQQMGTYRTTLQKLVKAYPNSPEAKEAQKMLKESPKGATN